ncbi:MAG: class I SAM-dependent methyltransferase family protein [Candidatus Methanoplasma sp.]|jgi:tRNA wybutosine-synthesizing protein 2|nr:class I SAM-dependent methyltransferase family protein [Candidatus Methanoplasma sp.]
MKMTKQARIDSSEASELIPYLMELGLVDRSAKISRDGDSRLVPILPDKEETAIGMGYELVEGSAYTAERRRPQERLLDRLSCLPPEIIPLLPMKWEYVGDIITIKLDGSCRPFGDVIGKAYAEVLGAKTVCADISGISGELRRPSTEILYGSETESVRLENGIFYEFDVSKIMFASGNVDERLRMKELECGGETVVDMFAGIGYFTLPLAKFSGARKVFACEKNPDSYRYLVKNIARNGVYGEVIPILGDNRDIPGKRFADRIIMGYVQTTSEFIPKALDMIRTGGIIHYHDTFYVGEYEERIENLFEENAGGKYEIERIREIKSFAPSVSHYVADVRIY